MEAQGFINALKIVVERSAINDTITNLDNSQSNRIDKQVSTWYQSLSPKEKEFIKSIITESVQTCLFGTLCVIDGVRAIEDNLDKGCLQLKYINDQKEILINDFDEEFLHDLYKETCI